MIPEKVNIAGIVHEVVFESEQRLRGALKELGVEDWQRRFSYWDPVDAKIYISQELPDQLKEFCFCLEVFRAWSFYIGDRLGEKDRIIRPYAAQLRLLLRSFFSKQISQGRQGAKEIHPLKGVKKWSDRLK